jgi:threonine/homoserine/homoserine lactone efflux protein
MQELLVMTSELLGGLVLFVFVASMTPGPNNMMLLASGVNFGFRRTVPHMLGITLGFGVMIVLAGLGAGQLFGRWPWLYNVLKVVSIGYLLWLAWKIATAGGVAGADAAADARPMTFLEAAAFQWVNPKGWTASLSAISAYTVPDQYLTTMLVVAAVFVAWSPVATIVWTLFGMQLKNVLSAPGRVRAFNVSMALVLVASLWPAVAEVWK